MKHQNERDHEAQHTQLLYDLDIDGLLQATRKVFPELLTTNLTKNTYRMIQYDSTTTLGTPKEGAFDDMLSIRLSGVVEEDRRAFLDAFSRSNLLDALTGQQKESVQLVYRRPGKNGDHYWFETTVMRQHNPFDEDILAVIISRNVDKQKAEDIRLRQELYLKAEEIRLTMTQLGKTLCYYDIPSKTLTLPTAYAKKRRIPEIIHNCPENMKDYQSNIAPETLSALQEFYAAICRGEPTGICEVAFRDRSGREYWNRLEYATIFDAGGDPRRAVIYLEDITDVQAQSAENRRLRENERILRMVAQHSDRTICYYDVKKKIIHPWEGENRCPCVLPYLSQKGDLNILNSGKVLSESVESMESMFQSIQDGNPSGETKLHIMTKEGERRWLSLKYSTIYDGRHKPMAALISYKDITDLYEQEVAYLRYIQSVEDIGKRYVGLIEVNLTTDVIEKQGGHLAPPGIPVVGSTLTEFGTKMVDMKLLEEDRLDGYRFFSREYLLNQYNDGNHFLERTWRMCFRNGMLGWVHTMVELVADPYTDHIRALIRLSDITKEKEEQIAVQNRAQRDGMTGLLNRATSEEQIRFIMEESRQKGGVLILLDLDDLKGINDTYGHEQGDRAIMGIAETLKSNFRAGDIIGRAGGDEFMVFLPGAAGNENTISQTLSALLRKLAGLSVGPEDERRIHCSIGCAVQIPEKDTFESLYRRADMALYHVKRNGKNNFTFYSPEMKLADYQFRKQKAFFLKNTKALDLGELRNLLSAISSFYPLVLSANLSANDFYIMEVSDHIFSQLPTVGTVDHFIRAVTEIVHPDDQNSLLQDLSRESLLAAYEQGETSIRCYFRYGEKNLGHPWMEATVIFYTNEDGDVCNFTLLRWAKEREQELDLLRLQKILELAVVFSFEYICLINVKTGKYYMYGNDGKNTHTIAQEGNFDEVTREIRDHHILPEHREEYYEKANLDNVLANMKNRTGNYSYRYSMFDGDREASFYWYEPTHSELLMTVRR